MAQLLSEVQVAQVEDYDSVLCAAVSPNGRYVATAQGETVGLYDVRKHQPLAHLEHRAVITAVVFSPDSQYLVTGDGDDGLQVFGAPGGDELWSKDLEGELHSSDVSFSADCSRMAAPIWIGLAEVWNTATGNMIARMHQDKESAKVALSPSGKYLATADRDCTVWLWRVDNEKHISCQTLERRVVDLAFPHEEHLLVAGAEHSDEGSICWVYDIMRGKEIAQLKHHLGVDVLCFSPDGNYLMTVGDNPHDLGFTAWVWNITSGRDIVHIKMQYIFKRIAFSPSSQLVAIANSNGDVRIFGLSDGSEMLPIAHEDTIVFVAFMHDERYLATVDSVGTFRLWQLQG